MSTTAKAATHVFTAVITLIAILIICSAFWGAWLGASSAVDNAQAERGVQDSVR
jgi:hypothetical protein